MNIFNASTWKCPHHPKVSTAPPSAATPCHLGAWPRVDLEHEKELNLLLYHYSYFIAAALAPYC